jgi:hypothetical protein
MLRMSTLGVRKFTDVVFYRGPHGQESEEGEEDRESYQESGKENVAKEIVVSRRETVAPDRNPEANKTFKDLKGPFHQRSGFKKEQDKIGPLCRRRRLHKGPVFRLCPSKEDVSSCARAGRPAFAGRASSAFKFLRARSLPGSWSLRRRF